MDIERDYELRLAEMTASTVLAGFESFLERFQTITLRAKPHFEKRSWHGLMADMGERLELHSVEVDRVIARLRWQIGAPMRNPSLWAEARRCFAGLAAPNVNRELGETFFNSTSRRVLATVGKSPETEFDSDESTLKAAAENPLIFRRHEWLGDTAAVVLRILDDCRFAASFENQRRDAGAVADEIDAQLARAGGESLIDAIEVIRPVFYRQKLAYVVGRILCGDRQWPLMLALRNEASGIVVDAVLMDESALSIVFSFTRSHLHVACPCPWDLIVFLRSIMPRKPLAELFIALGFHKHGKTELYRSLRGHLTRTDDRFEFARGDRGMVMAVITLPSHDVVLKIIRDRFQRPKQITRRDVLERYSLVFTHDRVGRLVEAQEFEHLEFCVDRFRPEVLEELQREARRTVEIRDGTVVLRHVYVERKVTPLNVYLREVPPAIARSAMQDYGQALKELAAANIFPGDFLLKNFGVTRHGRVVFYDYDELCLITDCNFRRIPPPRTPEDELADEPWFKIGEYDIFPEEFARFLEFGGELAAEFRRAHGDLFDVEFWSGIQQRLRAGSILDFYPYPSGKRLPRAND